MKASVVRPVRWLALLTTVAGLLWLVGCRTYESRTALPSGGYLGIMKGTPVMPPPANVIGDPLSGPAPPPGGALTPVPLPPPPSGTVVPSPNQDPYVAELLAILNETKSVDTFLVTLDLLTDAKLDYRAIVPTVIRNAERLGIFARHALQDQNGPEAEAFAAVNSAIETLTHREAQSGGRKSVPPRHQTVPSGYRAPEHIEERRVVDPGNNMPILPPLAEGEKPRCVDAPDRAAILRSMSRAERGVPGMYEIWREDFEFVTEKLVDKIDPPRFFPLIGPAQLHHCHWKCTVRYNETVEFASPCGFFLTRPQVEVVYIDRDRLYLWQPASVKTADERSVRLTAPSSDR